MISPDIDPQPIRILIAEDQPLMRRGLEALLSGEPDMIIVAEAADGNEALRLTRLRRPDIVLMDLQAPRLGGCPTIQRILAECPGTHVVVLTTFDTEEHVFEAVSSGVEAYLLKNASMNQVIDAVRAVMQKESWLEPTIARKILNEFRRIRPTTDELPNEPLTVREARILDLVIEGQNNKEIARTLFLAEGTVKNYVSRVMEKLNVRTRTELAIKGVRHPIHTPTLPYVRAS